VQSFRVTSLTSSSSTHSPKDPSPFPIPLLFNLPFSLLSPLSKPYPYLHPRSWAKLHVDWATAFAAAAAVAAPLAVLDPLALPHPTDPDLCHPAGWLCAFQSDNLISSVAADLIGSLNIPTQHAAAGGICWERWAAEVPRIACINSERTSCLQLLTPVSKRHFNNAPTTGFCIRGRSQSWEGMLQASLYQACLECLFRGVRTWKAVC